MISAGAGGTQYGVLTSTNQGGGSKKQGLVSTTNTPVELSHHIRTEGGGHQRHWVFCMNQLGGVGRRWGQNAGPGNRAGVSSACAAKAAISRISFPSPAYGARVSLAGLTLAVTYAEVAGIYNKDVGKTAVIQFEDQQRWVAWFTSDPAKRLPGTYDARAHAQLRIHIVHTGPSVDGSESYIYIPQSTVLANGTGTFVERLTADPTNSYASGPCRLGATPA